VRGNYFLRLSSPTRRHLALLLAPGPKNPRVAASYRSVAVGLIRRDPVPLDARISAVVSETRAEERVRPRHPSEIE